MYDELVKALRGCVLSKPCDGCPYYDPNGPSEKCATMNIAAADAIEKLSKPRWISVTERLPKKAGHYIVFVELKRDGQKISAWTQVTLFLGEFILECPEDEELFVATVTHWQPLPQPPKEEEA